MALPSLRPFYSYIIGSSLYLSSSYLQHVQIKCNKLQKHPKNRAVKNCRQVELQNHDNCENCCIHCPMSPHVSNCMQVTSNYLPLKTVDIKSKQWNEHHMNWHHKTWKIQNCCNCQIPTKPMQSFCKIVGRLLQTELDTLTTVSYTASASSSKLTASVVPRTASALKNVDNKQHNASKWKQLMQSSSNDLHSSSNDLQSSSNDLQSSSKDLQSSSNDLQSSSKDLQSLLLTLSCTALQSRL